MPLYPLFRQLSLLCFSTLLFGLGCAQEVAEEGAPEEESADMDAAEEAPMMDDTLGIAADTVAIYCECSDCEDPLACLCCPEELRGLPK